MIHFVGPGGAGKSTIGSLLALKLGTAFVDLDASFSQREGDISKYLQRYGYDAYAKQNVEVYRSLRSEERVVIALSSGFMTYPDTVHSSYVDIRAEIAARPTTFVLIPSLDLETCVAETVRRQMTRRFGLVATCEEAKIRTRFPVFLSLLATKIQTMRPPDETVTEILKALH
jgi:shikimate kinase